jgi:BON domain
MTMGIELDRCESKPEVSILSPLMNRVLQMAFAALVTGGMSACITTHKTEAERQADGALKDRVQAALKADDYLFSRHITIWADNGVVTLGGYVWTPVELGLARQDAQSTPGVIKVVDRMEVDRGAVSDSSVTR